MAKKATRLLREAAFELMAKKNVDVSLRLAREAEQWAASHYQPRLKAKAARLVTQLEAIKKRRLERDADRSVAQCTVQRSGKI